MNEREQLKEYKKQEDRLLLSQILDKIQLSQVKQSIENTDFLDMYQISLVGNFLRKIKFDDYELYGGYIDSERKILVIYPKMYNKEEIKKYCIQQLKIVRIILPKEEQSKYTHRNYLGGIVKLGLKREKIGDIIVFNEGADIITLESFANILQKELSNLTRFKNSQIEIQEINNIKKVEKRIEEIKIIIPSLRLDNIVSSIVRTSRSKAVEIINQERVFVNGQNETKVSKQVKINDIITIRGKGRFIIKKIDGTTRSGRTVIVVEKYI